ncbi:delta(14)-sterol reductase LBR-like isoform X4 [Heptranchias perlo]|uniref:delta(14)-sterol reductase LBR-like isoform X4 n=1 Tax=Heptranchias perlo TaxID=212740 RepID=UPI003559990E
MPSLVFFSLDWVKVRLRYTMNSHCQNQGSSFLRKKEGNIVREESDQIATASARVKDTRRLALLSVCLPVLVLYLLNKCKNEDGSKMLSFFTLWDLNSFFILIGFVLFQMMLYLLPIGKVVKGKRTTTGEQDHYHINGFYAILITIVVLGSLWFFGLADVTIGHDKCLQIAFSGISVSVFLSIVWFLKSFTVTKEQLKNYGEKALLQESVVFTKEITSDMFGYIMTFGEIVWIPFTSSLQAIYLLHHPQELTYLQVAIIVLIYAVGFFIYNRSNDQKNKFRSHPQDVAFAGLETIDTNTGTKLLVSEWWGWLRHPNYLGDIVVHLAWSLPCGFSHIIPYLQLLFCIHILTKRTIEIEEDCHRRYGAAWEEYCRRVKYRMLPYIY